MVDAPDSKSGVLMDVGVRNPPPAPVYIMRADIVVNIGLFIFM